MKLYSKFYDYYDKVLAYGVDPLTVYKRKTEKFTSAIFNNSNVSNEFNQVRNTKIIDDIFKILPTTGIDYGMNLFSDMAFIIIFCGEVYPCIKYQYDRSYGLNSNPESFCYNYDSVTKVVDKFCSKKERKRFYKAFKPMGKKRRYSYSQKNTPSERLKQLYSFSGQKYESLVNLHCKTGIPIFMIKHNTLLYNPKLKEVEFYKIINPFQAFQKLSMFISGVMGGQAPPMIQISDKIRLEKHGFNKYSFRKDKKVK